LGLLFLSFSVKTFDIKTNVVQAVARVDLPFNSRHRPVAHAPTSARTPYPLTVLAFGIFASPSFQRLSEPARLTPPLLSIHFSCHLSTPRYLYFAPPAKVNSSPKDGTTLALSWLSFRAVYLIHAIWLSRLFSGNKTEIRFWASPWHCLRLCSGLWEIQTLHRQMRRDRR
jgi:hypothetical protein